MKNKPSKKDHDAVSTSNGKSSQPPSEKTGILKRFLAWIARGSKKTCPT